MTLEHFSVQFFEFSVLFFEFCIWLGKHMQQLSRYRTVIITPNLTTKIPPHTFVISPFRHFQPGSDCFVFVPTELFARMSYKWKYVVL